MFLKPKFFKKWPYVILNSIDASPRKFKNFFFPPKMPARRKGPPKPAKRTEKVAHELDPENIENTLALCPPVIHQHGLLKIPPYSLIRKAFVKGRWMGKTLKQVYQKEFGTEINQNTIKYRNLKINGQLADSPDVILDQNYFIESTHHFHEKPVLNDPVEIVYEDAGVIVCNKPNSIPIHPCGCFKYSSLQYQLAVKYRQHFKIIHRLDALTSGIVMLGKNKETVSKYSELIRNRKVHKKYLARVIGKFPDTKIICKRPIYYSNAKAAGLTSVVGKGAETHFTKVFDQETEVDLKNGSSKAVTTSVISCQLFTGRTHQIRIHLMSLGFPIINDPIYNSPNWSNSRFVDCQTADMEYDHNDDLPNKKSKLDGDSSGPKNLKQKTWDFSEEELAVVQQIPDNIGREEVEGRTSIKNGLEIFGLTPEEKKVKDSTCQCSACSKYRDLTCYGCMQPLPDPVPDALRLYLHSFEYQIDGKTFTTSTPEWADQNQKFDLSKYYVDKFLTDYPDLAIF